VAYDRNQVLNPTGCMWFYKFQITEAVVQIIMKLNNIFAPFVPIFIGTVNICPQLSYDSSGDIVNTLDAVFDAKEFYIQSTTLILYADGSQIKPNSSICFGVYQYFNNTLNPQMNNLSYTLTPTVYSIPETPYCYANCNNAGQCTAGGCICNYTSVDTSCGYSVNQSLSYGRI